jgi:tetratricopeptide (TPR) repeat protein
VAELARISRFPRGVPWKARRVAPHQRYMAFLSYSHQDMEEADWLHETLEQFRVPPKLVGQLTDLGAVPKRLTPIFRDRHELAAAGDLGEEIEEAIGGSRFLIVLCSPAAAKSRWINEEIISFKRQQDEDRILAAIIDGEPFASDIEGREDEECFPPAMRVHYDKRGRPTAERVEPLAADLRESGDGRRMGLLKIAAGMLGVGLDDLAQREAHRRQKRMMFITAASVAGMLLTSGLAYTAIDARDEARDQRREAEGLIGFMLGDLREKLAPIGRLDVLDSVGTRALKYYEGQDKASLSDEALAQRSKALTLMGEMAQARGDLDGALARYREAMQGTAEALRRTPDNAQRLFEHAQNVFWVGYIDYQRGDLDKAGAAFLDYRRLADRMVALAPDKPEYQLERIYADTNRGTVLMEQRRYRAAADAYQQTLEPAEALVAGEPDNRAYKIQLGGVLAWLSDAREFSGQLDEALAHRQHQLRLLGELWASNRGDTIVRRYEMSARGALARLHFQRGRIPQALSEARRASALVDWLTRMEPNDTEWMQAGAVANFERARVELASGNLPEARAAARSGCDSADRLIARDRSVSAWRSTMQLYCLEVETRIAMREAPDQAVSLAQRGLAIARGEKNDADRAMWIALSEKLLGDALARAGQIEAAQGAYRRALESWPRNVEKKPRELADHAVLLRREGRRDEAATLDGRLNAIGYRQPDYLAARRG